MVIDFHAHIFPYLGGASGFDSPATHMMFWQKEIARNPAAPVRNLQDGTLVEDPSLWQMVDDEGEIIEVNFRAGQFGRFQWTKNGNEFYVHVYAPSLQDMTGSPEFMMAQMAWAGVDFAVLQNPWLYGQLNEYFADAVEEYPHRFAGQIQVKEFEIDKEEQINSVRHGVTELGLTGGLYFTDKRAWEYEYQHNIDDDKYFPFWEEVQDLDIPVSMDLSALFNPEHPGWSELKRFTAQMKRFDRIAGQFPRVSFVITHGILLTVFGSGDQIVIPEPVWEIWQKPNIFVEILFPIQVSYPRPGASVWDYPYPHSRPAIKELYEKLGPEKIVWGSDMPNVERNCTYKQSLDYLVRYCDFIPPEHMDLIIGGNAARLLKLEGNF